MSGQVPGGPQASGPAPAAQTSAAQTLSQAGASPVEDGRSPVAGAARRELSTGTKLGLLALIGVLGLGFIWFNALFSHKRAAGSGAAPALYTNGGEVFAGPPAEIAKPAVQTLPAPADAQAPLLGATQQSSPQSAPILAYSGSSVPTPVLSLIHI